MANRSKPVVSQFVGGRARSVGQRTRCFLSGSRAPSSLTFHAFADVTARRGHGGLAIHNEVVVDKLLCAQAHARSARTCSDYKQLRIVVRPDIDLSRNTSASPAPVRGLCSGCCWLTSDHRWCDQTQLHLAATAEDKNSKDVRALASPYSRPYACVGSQQSDPHGSIAVSGACALLVADITRLFITWSHAPSGVSHGGGRVQQRSRCAVDRAFVASTRTVAARPAHSHARTIARRSRPSQRGQWRPVIRACADADCARRCLQKHCRHKCRSR